MCLCTVALIRSCVKQQESLPWLQWFGDLALMLALRNKQKLLLWQCEIIVSFVCHGAPAHRANKAQLTSRSAQPEMHFRKAFARVLSNQSDKHETNVTAIFSSTKLHFINTYLWLDQKIHGLASQCWIEYTRQCRNYGAAVSHTREAELVWGAAGSKLCRRAREVHHGSGLGGWFHRSQTLAMCGKQNKNLYWADSRCWYSNWHSPARHGLHFMTSICFTYSCSSWFQRAYLSKAERPRCVFVAKHSHSKTEGNNNFSVKTVAPQGKKKKPAVIESSF